MYKIWSFGKFQLTNIFIAKDADIQNVAELISGATVAEVRVSDSVIQEASMKRYYKQWWGHPGSSEFTMGESNKFLRGLCYQEYVLPVWTERGREAMQCRYSEHNGRSVRISCKREEVYITQTYEGSCF